MRGLMIDLDLRAPEIKGELDWMGDALCAQTDPDAFNPEKGGSTRGAKKSAMGAMFGQIA